MSINAKYQIDSEENKQFLSEFRENLLNFGHGFPSPGGSCYWLGDDGTPMFERTRDTYETCRMVHVYCIGSFMGYERSLDLVNAGLKGIRGELHDAQYGGWYSSLTQDGTPVAAKQCYTHAFVLLAATSAMLAGVSGADELLNEAIDVYDRYFWEESAGLSLDTWNNDFTKCDPYRGLNANMHSVEAFLAVADVAGLEEFRVRAGRIINHVVKWASENSWRIPEHFFEDWTPNRDFNIKNPNDPFKPYGATPGHGMEWARLIAQWALSTYKDNNAERDKYISYSKELYMRAFQDAWYVDGEPGLIYTTDWEGKPVIHDRMHWVLCEAINTSAMLYRLSGERRYADDYEQLMKYLDEKVIDKVNGSAFHQMDRYNHVIGTVWPGKNDLYHAVQATLIPYYAPDMSIAKAVKDNNK